MTIDARSDTCSHISTREERKGLILACSTTISQSASNATYRKSTYKSQLIWPESDALVLEMVIYKVYMQDKKN